MEMITARVFVVRERVERVVHQHGTSNSGECKWNCSKLSFLTHILGTILSRVFKAMLIWLPVLLWVPSNVALALKKRLHGNNLECCHGGGAHRGLLGSSSRILPLERYEAEPLLHHCLFNAWAAEPPALPHAWTTLNNLRWTWMGVSHHKSVVKSCDVFNEVDFTGCMGMCEQCLGEQCTHTYIHGQCLLCESDRSHNHLSRSSSLSNQWEASRAWLCTLLFWHPVCISPKSIVPQWKLLGVWQWE